MTNPNAPISGRPSSFDEWLQAFKEQTSFFTGLRLDVGVPRWQLYVDPRPRRDQNYALWFLEEFFEYIRPPGFSFVDDRDEKKSSP